MAFRSFAVPAGNPTTSFTVTIPADVVTGDILLLVTSNGGASAAPTVTDNDTGGNTWTSKLNQANGSENGSLFWKRATSGTASKTITASGFTDSSAGVLAVYSGRVTTGDPFNQATAEANASADETHAGFTTTVDGCDVGLANAVGDNLALSSQTCTSPGTLTERAEKLSTGGLDTAAAIADAPQSTQGATGAFTWAMTNATSVSLAWALAPVGATTFFQTIAATAVGVSVLTPVTTFVRTLAAVEVGVAGLTKALVASVSMPATAVGVPTLTPATIFTETLAAVAVGAATMLKKISITLAATAAGLASIIKGMYQTLAATAVGAPTLTTALVATVTMPAVAVGTATVTATKLVLVNLAALAVGVATMTTQLISGAGNKLSRLWIALRIGV